SGDITYSSYQVAISPDGKLIAIANGDALKLWNPSTGNYVGELRHEENVSSIAFSSDGTLLAVGTKGGGVKIWIAASQKLLSELHRKGKNADDADRIYALAFSPDGKSLVFNHNNVIEQWDRSLTKKLRQREFYRIIKDRADEDATAEAAVFSPDGHVLAVGYSDGDAVLYDSANGKELHVLMLQKEATSYLAFSPDGGLLLTGGDDGTLKLW